MSQSADRNLLFGILALQNNFISSEQLLTGFNAWVVAKDKALGTLLQDQGALAAERRQLLEALVQEHLKQHAADPQQSLAAVPVSSRLKEQIKSLCHPDLEASLAQLGADSERDPEATRSQSVGEASTVGQRFRILRPHAEGGLGKVSVALDEELNREVALKEIKEKHADDPSSRGRFVLEAEITGGLEHPGIVPVYGLGNYADGRPFYAMRFIRGDSLKDAIARFHTKRSTADTVDFLGLKFRQLLGRFVDVCNAIAYAHSRGVLHRDLKPGNIMLGKYGETLVVDWGLAKPAGRSGPWSGDDEPTLRPASGRDSPETLAGQAVGTPRFMSPEQAAGRLDLLGTGSDVYSLGATLYCLLTGHPPFNDSDAGAVVHKVQRGEFSPPRQLKTDVPRALEAVCLKAMALKPEARYATPRALADDLEHWLADEPMRAWREPRIVRAGRWMRRHKPLVSAAAAALIAITLGGTGAGIWYAHDRAQRQAEETVRQAEITARQTQVNREVLAAVKEADTLLRDLRARIEDPLKIHELLSAIDKWKSIVGEAQHAERRARAAAAGQEHLLEPDVAQRFAACSALVDAEEKNYRLAQKLDAIRLEAATLVEGKYAPEKIGRKYAVSFRDLEIDIVKDAPNELADQVTASPIRHALVSALDQWLIATTLPRAPDGHLRPKLVQILRRADSEPWRTRFRAELALFLTPRLKELVASVDFARQSPQIAQMFALAMQCIDEDPVPVLRSALLVYPIDFWLHFDMGNFVEDLGRRAAHYQAALALRPTSAAAYNNVGLMFFYQKQFSEALTAYRKAIELEPSFAMAYSNVGLLLREQKKLPEAMNALNKAIELDPKLGMAFSNLGLVLVDQNKKAEAMAAFQKAVDLHPGSSEPYNNLGVMLFEQNKLAAALDLFEKAIMLEPKKASLHFNRGNALARQNKPPEAKTAYRKAIDLDPKCADAYGNLGHVLLQQNRFPEATTAYEHLVNLNPNNASAHNNLGFALLSQRILPEAIAAFPKAVELQPKFNLAYLNLGNAFYYQRKFPDAIGAYEKAIATAPSDSRPHYGLGLIFREQAKFCDAQNAFTKASERGLALAKREIERCRNVLAFVGREKLEPVSLDVLRQGLSGALAMDSPLDAFPETLKSFRGSHAVRLKARQTYQIDLRANFDTLLRVEDELFQGQALNDNVSPPADRNSRVIFTPSKDAIYRLVATSIAPEKTGPYTLSLREVFPEGDPQILEGKLSRDSSDWQGKYGQTHKIDLLADRPHVLELHSKSFDAYLVLLDETGKQVLAENDDAEDGNTDSRIHFTPERTGTYTVIATTLNRGEIGAYTLRVQRFAQKK